MVTIVKSTVYAKFVPGPLFWNLGSASFAPADELGAQGRTEVLSAVWEPRAEPPDAAVLDPASRGPARALR